jgi:divalent metal cation (Fe/Co/Zn/Cd) transporter
LRNGDIDFTNLRTRRAGSRNFVYVDVLVPAQWTVLRAHEVLNRIEKEVAAALPDTVTFTHAEPAPGRRKASSETSDRSRGNEA